MPGDDSETDQTWCIVGQGAGLTVGPARAFPEHAGQRARITLREARTKEDLGPVTRTIPVRESGVREFEVSWYEPGAGDMVARNPAGGNQVGWAASTDADWWFSPGRDPLQTSVYQRFLLRHLTTALLERDLGGRSIHAVTSAWGGGVLAVAGPTRAGKTRLMNHLAGQGLVGPLVDDDCPVLTGGSTATLVPRRYEVERATLHELRGLILLTDEVQEPQPITTSRAHALLETTPVPWPASWLPAEQRPPLPPLPQALRVIEAPAQDEGCFSVVAACVADGLITRS